jgi:hypothetical protein
MNAVGFALDHATGRRVGLAPSLFALAKPA